VKFSGDPKKFRQWYLSVMAQLSIAPWQSLYDSSTNSVVTNTVNSALNGKLYAKVIGALEGSALQHMLARKHLRANGILLLQELHQMYKPKCVPEVIASKTVEFWGHTKRLSSESVDEYYNRFQELLEEINEEVVTIPTQNAIRHFIFTLGDEFQPLQNNFRLGTISEDWKTQDWPSLLVLCRDFYNSVNPKGPMVKRDRIQDRDPFTELCIDRNTHHKKIRMWLMNPIKHKSNIESEQSKFPGRCLYHLSKTHSTVDCNVTKECNKLIASKRNASALNGSNSSGTSSTSGNLRHITEEVYEDAIDAVDPTDESNVHSDNDTNETDLLYFARVSKHYLHLVKNDSLNQDPPRHIMKYPIIIDSGANFHMFRDREFFTALAPATGKVILGDGVTSLPILGVGTVQCIIGSHTLTIENVRCIPTLSESVYSLFIHVQQVNHSIHSSFDQGLFLQFPEFQTKAIIGQNDLYLDAIPTNNHLLHQSFTDPIVNSAPVYRNIKVFQQELDTEMEYIDNLLIRLRQYYDTIKTKRQLQLEVPAGFRRIGEFQKLRRLYLHHQQQSDSDILDDIHAFDLVASTSSFIQSEVSNRVLSGKSFVPACKYILTRWYVCLFVYLFICLFVYLSVPFIIFFLRQIMSFTSVVRAHNISVTASPTSIIYTYKNPTWLIC
jgi:hypothetical protein